MTLVLIHHIPRQNVFQAYNSARYGSIDPLQRNPERACQITFFDYFLKESRYWLSFFILTRG
jgi:hypothetical protein